MRLATTTLIALALFVSGTSTQPRRPLDPVAERMFEVTVEDNTLVVGQ